MRPVVIDITFAVVIFISATAGAEYRAFRLKIVDTATSQERTVTSRLDDIQYPMYFHTKRSEVLSIEQTWMCWERNDYVGTTCSAPVAAGPVSGDQDRSPAGTPTLPPK